jgi:uroporphyrinogen decarboxylase
MRREAVLKAVHFSGPAYVPVYYFNRDQDHSDIVALDVQHHFLGPGRDRSEWGFTWQRLDQTMGQPRSYLIADWEDLNRLRAPDPAASSRFAGVEAFTAAYPDRFRLAALGLSGFTTMWCLREFDRLMLDLVEDPNHVAQLADIVFGFEEELIRQLPRHGFDAVAFFDDWGTQSGLLVSPGLWRRMFKPRYARQFALAHRLGLHVYFHCCGQISAIIPDMIEIGVDLLNLSQPNLYDIAEIGRLYGGRVCFVCPVSYQTTSITGARADIFRDVQELVTHLGCFGGGLVGYVEEYPSIGMSEANYQACVEAFRLLGRYPLTAPQV